MTIAIIAFIGIFPLAWLLLGALFGGGKDEAPQPEAPKPLRRATQFHLIDFQKTNPLSAIPWLNRWLSSFEVGTKARVLLSQADLNWTAGKLLLMSATGYAASVLVIYQVTSSLTLGLVIAIVIGSLPSIYVYLKRNRRFSLIEEQLPAALDMISSALRAGNSFNSALGMAARECPVPIKREFKTCFDEQNFGLDLATALRNLVNRVPLPDIRISTTAILIQKECGGNLAEVLTNTSHVIRERFRLKRQIRVHTAHGRITGWVISAIPVVLLILLSVINPKMESVLWKKQIGVELLWGSGGMMCLGAFVIQRIIRMDA